MEGGYKLDRLLLLFSSEANSNVSSHRHDRILDPGRRSHAYKAERTRASTSSTVALSIAMLRRVVTSLPRASPVPTYWSAQVNVIGELLRARRGTLQAHQRAVSTSEATCTTSTQNLRRPKNVGAATSKRLPSFSSFSSVTSSSILGTLARPRTSTASPLIKIRAFHASQPQGLPAPAVILAAGALLKASFSTHLPVRVLSSVFPQSTGAWAVFTVLSRILFTLVPVSLMASRKISAKGAKYAKSHAPATISPAVRKYYTTFCEGEVCKRPQRKEMWRTAEQRGGVQGLSKGKVVYCPGPTKDKRAIFSVVYKDTVNVSRQRTGLDPLSDDDIHFPESRHAMWFTPFFYLPELSPAARRALEKMSNEEKEQLFELRCHEAHKGLIASKVKRINGLFVCFILLPFMVFAATALLSLERTPYSGR